MTDHPPVLDLSLNDGSSNLGYCCHYGQNAQDIGLDCSFSITAQPPPPFPVSIGGTDMSEKQEYQFQKATGISGHVNSAVSKQKSSINFSIDTSSQWQDSPQSIWSHKDIQEAFLMRYFVEELAQWFDSCDASRHFAVTIPHKAPNCPALLYAIFSASARHLSRSQQTKANDAVFSGKKLPYLGEDTALEYQSLCITHLIKLSGDSIEVQDEDLLAAAVILRFYEEVDAPLAGVDGETYLRGTQVFLSAQSASAIRAGGLQLAAFWVGIRQEFHTGFLKQRPFQLDLNCCSTSTFRLLDPADDCTWANRIILHCAETLTFCHGEDGQTIEKYKELLDYNQAWQILTPPTFNPIYSRQPDRAKGEVFPAIWYLDDCIVTAIQHWHLAKILLAVFDPNVPRMGPGRRALVARREAEIKDNVFRLCGIALSNRTAPALITACMGVSMCGDRVTDHSEQEALLGILVKTEKTHSLSTAKAQKDLQEAWGWTMPTKTLQVSGWCVIENKDRCLRCKIIHASSRIYSACAINSRCKIQKLDF